MAILPASKTDKNAIKADAADLEAEVARLREDISRLTEQLGRTGEHTVAAARRAASDGAEQLRAKGEAAMDTIKSKSGALEQQISEVVREKPITALAMAAGIGFFFAFLSRR